MKTKRISYGLLIALAAILTVLIAVNTATSRESLLDLVPGDPLVVLTANDLPQLAAHVRALPAAGEYLGGEAHDAYQDSKLALKLADRAKRLSKLAGMPLEAKTLLAHAGGETVLALYDIGELTFLALVRMSPAEQARLAFVESRADFTERVYKGRTYRAKSDYAAGLSFVFYQQGDLLMVGNSVDLIEGALLAQSEPAAQPRLVADERYRQLLAVEPDIGKSDALLYLDMKRLRGDRYFKAYWAWRNFDDFAALDAALVGFDCDGQSMRERRALLGPPDRQLQPQLTYDGPGLTAFAHAGEKPTARIAAHLGWPLTQPLFDGQAHSYLLVAQPAEDDDSGMIALRLGAVIAGGKETPQAVIEEAIAGLRQAMPGLSNAVAPQQANDVVSLTGIEALPGAYATRAGELLVLANNRELLQDLVTKVRTGDAGPLATARVDGEAARMLADFLVQADRLGAIQSDGSTFAAHTLPAILRAAGRFRQMTTVNGIRFQETRWQ